MRLWHSKLIPLLDGKRLCDLHMSCCNLRGNGWGKRNAAVGYLYEDPLGEDALAAYHHLVLKEMLNRGMRPDRRWVLLDYCGKQRPMRQGDPDKYMEALRRNIPLKGHTVRLYLNDVKALQERGLDVRLFCRTDFDDKGSYTIYRARRGNVETTYGIRL